MRKLTNGSIKNINLSKLVSILPEQGCVELQQDRPKHIHNWHKHDVDETLIVIQGRITFGVESKEVTCGPGEYEVLPAGTACQSSRTRRPVGEEDICRWIVEWTSVRCQTTPGEASRS